jgi:hypothetical protein
MALRNLEVKKNNVGINNQIVMFYSIGTSIRTETTKKPNKISTEQPAVTNKKYDDFIDALKSLGLDNVKASQVESAIQKSFPDGTENVSEDEMLREIFRYLKCQNFEHKPRA